MDFTSPLQLRCQVQHYAWGKVGSDSLVAQLVDEKESNQPCAELWVGAHPKASALVVDDSGEQSLLEVLKANPEQLLGKAVVERFGAQLPFLFKILSIQTALSIQAHPDKALAKKLHQQAPEHYPDENHKPEIAIALSSLSYLYGFRPWAEISAFLDAVPELRSIVGENICAKDIKTIFQRVLSLPPEQTQEQCQALFARLRAKADRSPEENWIVGLSELYPLGDPGIWCLYLLNYGELAAGEALYLEANVPHCYLEGEIAECMANSDNVVRAGLTSKFRDVDTLIEMSNYEMKKPDVLLAQSESLGFSHYETNAEEFLVEVSNQDFQSQHNSSAQAELLFALSGNGCVFNDQWSMELRAGTALLLPASVGSYSIKHSAGQIFRIKTP